jgi:P4 family phage/plasmid primase-like protien
MAQELTLHKFLENNKADGVLTHTSMAGGKYYIPEDKLDQFYDLYVESILNGDKQYLVEKPRDIGPLRIDFDFVYDGVVKTHQHTQEQVVAFAETYIKTVGQYVQLPKSVDMHIMEKRKPTYELKGNRTKSGIHIVVPNVLTHKLVEQSVRRTLVKQLGDFFPNLPLKDPSWEKVYDKGVVDRSVNWTLYGSRKNGEGTLPYETQYILRYNDSKLNIVNDVPKLSKLLLHELSMRQDDSKETPMTDEGKGLYSQARQTIEDVRISGGDTTKKRGRPVMRGSQPGSRGSSPAGRVLQPLDADRKMYLSDHVMNLNQDRVEEYEKWLQVGQCLHNIHPDLMSVFLDFSAQWSQYNEADCVQKWNGLTFRNEGARLGVKSLLFWSREDDLEEYDAIEKRNIERLILEAISGTENDVASVIYAKFRDNYKCSDFRNNVWYRWIGHIWRETDQGIDLQLKLSNDVAKMFLSSMRTVIDDMDNRGMVSCSNKDGKTDCGVCEYCKLETQRSGLNKIYTRLKTTAFKSNVMKECREKFFDEDFSKKADANKDLIAFNNGVLDLTTMEFRDGKPDDYITFSTGIDYEEERQYHDHPAWPMVEKFIKQVLPDPEVREYFINHLATNLIGGNPVQKFHILTGSGSNGKSMIMNLMTKALGDYACTVPISLFTQQRKGSGNAAPEVIRLKGRRFVTMQEPDESIALNTGLMKEITSGEKMYARDLFKSGCEFEVQAKFHLACNDKPKINTTDGGTWRRLVVINFVSKFVSNPVEPNEYPLDESIQFAVNSMEWATPFLSYLIYTLKNGTGLRKLAPPSKVMEYTSEYRNENDAIAKFIDDNIRKIEPGEEIEPLEKNTLKKVFKTWKDNNDGKALLATDMIKKMEAQFGKYHAKGWTNVKLV